MSFLNIDSNKKIKNFLGFRIDSFLHPNINVSHNLSINLFPISTSYTEERVDSQ